MTQVTEVSLHVKCPICGLEKDINVPAYVFESKQFGALKIQIPKGSVCAEHQFLIYVDTKGNIRSYETSDFHLPTAIKHEEKKALLKITDFVGMVGEFATLNVIHALLLDLPIYLVQTKFDPEMLEQMEKTINNTLTALLPGFFKNHNDLRIIDRKELYGFRQTDLILAIDQFGYILICPWEINKFEIEQEILEKVLKLDDFKQQKIIFQQLLTTFFRKLNYVGDLLLKQEVISIDDLKSEFKKTFMQKRVSNYEIELIKAVLTHRFKKDTSKIQQKAFNKLKESLW
ncbi:MAG: hypothetical protein EU530_01040 [Promethearchaeota archaeon]|nr:MAG: hypothetical protein EU530_01040 [Candidatus Lokiarchaeota archaeon]